MQAAGSAQAGSPCHLRSPMWSCGEGWELHKVWHFILNRTFINRSDDNFISVHIVVIGERFDNFISAHIVVIGDRFGSLAEEIKKKRDEKKPISVGRSRKRSLLLGGGGEINLCTVCEEAE